VRQEIAVVSSTEAFPTAGLALQVELPTASAKARSPHLEAASVVECSSSGVEVAGTRSLYHEAAVAASIQPEASVATSKAAQLLEILLMA
jgi:hypothetical protein